MAQPSQPMLPPLSDTLKEEMARADVMRIVGVDIGLASSVCLAKLEGEYHIDLSYLRGLLTRKDDRDIAYLNATAIGKKFSKHLFAEYDILNQLILGMITLSIRCSKYKNVTMEKSTQYIFLK